MALYNKGLLKKRAVEVLSSAYLLRNVRQATPVDEDSLLAAMRSFRSEILKFKKQVGLVKNIQDARHDVGSEILLAKNECFKHLFQIQDQQESMVDYNLKYISAYIQEMGVSTTNQANKDKSDCWERAEESQDREQEDQQLQPGASPTPAPNPKPKLKQKLSME